MRSTNSRRVQVDLPLAEALALVEEAATPLTEYKRGAGLAGNIADLHWYKEMGWLHYFFCEFFQRFSFFMGIKTPSVMAKLVPAAQGTTVIYTASMWAALDPFGLTTGALDQFEQQLLAHLEWREAARSYGLAFHFASGLRNIEGEHEGLEFSIRQETSPVLGPMRGGRRARVLVNLPGAMVEERVWARAGKGDSGNPVLDMLIDSHGIPESVVDQVLDLVHGRRGVIEKGRIRVLWDGDMKDCLQTMVHIAKALESTRAGALPGLTEQDAAAS